MICPCRRVKLDGKRPNDEIEDETKESPWRERRIAVLLSLSQPAPQGATIIAESSETGKILRRSSPSSRPFFYFF
jgi:hypothetical protein